MVAANVSLWILCLFLLIEICFFFTPEPPTAQVTVNSVCNCSSVRNYMNNYMPSLLSAEIKEGKLLRVLK